MGRLNGGLDTDKLFKEVKAELKNNPGKYNDFHEKYKHVFTKSKQINTEVQEQQDKPESQEDVYNVSSEMQDSFTFKGVEVKLPKGFHFDSDGRIYDKDNNVALASILCDCGALFTDGNGIKSFIPYGLPMDMYDKFIKENKIMIACAIKELLCNVKATMFIHPADDGDYFFDFDSFDKDNYYRRCGYTKRDTLDIALCLYMTVISSKLITALSIYNSDGVRNMISELLDSDEFYLIGRTFPDETRAFMDEFINYIIKENLN